MADFNLVPRTPRYGLCHHMKPSFFEYISQIVCFSFFLLFTSIFFNTDCQLVRVGSEDFYLLKNISFFVSSFGWEMRTFLFFPCQLIRIRVLDSPHPPAPNTPTFKLVTCLSKFFRMTYSVLQQDPLSSLSVAWPLFPCRPRSPLELPSPPCLVSWL